MTGWISAVLLAVIAVCAVLVTYFVVALADRLRDTLDRWDRLEEALQTRLSAADEVMVDARGALQAIERTSETAESIGRDIGAVTTKARETALPALESVATLTRTLRHVAALAVGIKAGLAAVSGARAEGDAGRRSDRERSE